MARPNTALPKTIPLPQKKDWAVGHSMGDRCCLLGWAIRAFGGAATRYCFAGEEVLPTKLAHNFARAVVIEALGKPVPNYDDSIVSSFDNNPHLNWSAAWAKVARKWGYTRRCKVPRPAPL